MSRTRVHLKERLCRPGRLERLRYPVFLVLFLFILDLTPVLSPVANADAVSEFAGIITDPFKLGRASDNMLQSVEKINAMLKELEGRTNQDLRDRIAQVQALVDGVISAVDRNVKDVAAIITNAEAQINQLEKTILYDAEELLSKVQCTVRVVVDQDIESGLSKILDQLRAANPTLTLFGIPVWKLTVKQIMAEDPIEAYRATKAALLAEYQKLGPGDLAYKVPLTFANIANLAYLTRCEDLHNTKPAMDQILLKDEIEYKARQQPWTSVLSPTFF